MFDVLPDAWAVKSLGEIADTIMGQSPPSASVSAEANGLPFIQGNAEFGARHPSPVLFATDTPRIAAEGDVLLSVRAPVGEVNIALGALCIGRGVAALRARGCNSDFLYYLAGSMAPQLARLSQGSTFDAINGKDLRSISLPIPPLDEQRRIAEVLRAVDQHIDLTGAALAVAHSTKNAVLIAGLSEGWQEATVGSLLANTRFPMRSGPFGSALLKSELVSDGIPFLGINNVHVERFVPVYRRFISEAKYQELARYTVFPNDIMVTIMGTVGRCCVVPSDVGTAISSKHVWTITLDMERYSPSLLAWQINHAPWALQQLRGSAQGGIMSAISSGTLRELVVPVPPPTELREFEAFLLSSNASISALEDDLEQANRLKTILSTDLLSGRVRVPA
jgi:type I restriction enzyme S subunit